MKFTVSLEVEVTNATNESEARKAAYDLAATLNQAPKKRRGRKGAEAVAATAAVVGIKVEAEEKQSVTWGGSKRGWSQPVKDYMSQIDAAMQVDEKENKVRFTTDQSTGELVGIVDAMEAE